MISGNYSSPIAVNGFTCLNCTDVAYAQKQIDPAHPQSGPDNANAANDPSQPAAVRLKLADAKTAAEGAVREVAFYSARGPVPRTVDTGLVVDALA